MLKRTKYFIGGLFVALTVGAIAQTGGLPSRPRFLSVGVGTQAPSTNGDMNVAGSVTANRQKISGSAPELIWNETDASENNKLWKIFANNEKFVGAVSNDADSTGTVWMVIDRTGNTVDSINMQATSVQANGSEVCRANEVGCFEHACGLSIAPLVPSIQEDNCNGTQTVSSCGTGCLTLQHNLGTTNYHVVCSTIAAPMFCSPSSLGDNTVRINTWNSSGTAQTPAQNIHVILVK